MPTNLLLDRYEILETIGRGGSSEILKAFDRRMERVVAIKAIPARKKTALRALHEARTVALLNHPNIVTLYEFEETEDFYYLIMEFIEGITLQEYLEDNSPLKPEIAIAITIEVCQALENAHLNNVIHRDIKPANLMLMPDGRVKVMDFGVSKLKGVPVTREGTIAGTFTYMSPEQADGQLVDERSDVWSLGVVLYEMITGINPFNADTPAAAVLKILNLDPEPPAELNSKISAQLSKTILKALEKFPGDRYDLATDFRYKLERYRRSNQSPQTILRAAIDFPTPVEEINPNTQPITYFRLKAAALTDKYGHIAARLGIFAALAIAILWFGFNYSQFNSLIIYGFAAFIFFTGLIFPHLGWLAAAAFITLAAAFISLLGAALTALLFGVYWYVFAGKRPLPATLPFIAPLFLAAGIPFIIPIGAAVTLEGNAAPLISALSFIAIAAFEINFHINGIMSFIPTTGPVLIRAFNPMVFWQLGAWALAAFVGGLISRVEKLTMKLLGLAAATVTLILAYQSAPAYLHLWQPISPNFMQSMSFSFIIVLALLLIFYHPHTGRVKLKKMGSGPRRKNGYISGD